MGQRGKGEVRAAINVWSLPELRGGGPRVVISTAAFHARVRGSFPGLCDLKETEMFLLHPLVENSVAETERYYVRPQTPRRSSWPNFACMYKITISTL